MSDSHSRYNRNGKEVRDSYSMLLLCRAFMAREDGEKEKCLSYLQLAEEEAGRGLLRYVKGETKEKILSGIEEMRTFSGTSVDICA